MITECWTPQSSHRDTFFSIYLVTTEIHLLKFVFNEVICTDELFMKSNGVGGRDYYIFVVFNPLSAMRIYICAAFP